MTRFAEAEAALADEVRAAHDAGAAVEIVGGGTRGALGRPVDAARRVSTAALSGISLYDPGALTLVAGAGTPVAEIEAALAAENQRLAFEPMDHRALLGTDGAPTIGAVAAINASGPRRIQAGAARDAMLGVRMIDGRGAVIRNGGRVMKNVTGYDLVKLATGSWGTLGVLTEVALKVLPRPEASAVLLIEGLADAAAAATLSAALGSPYDVTGAAHLPVGVDGAPVTMIRLEGFETSVKYRAEKLRAALAAHGAAEIETDPARTAAGWRYVRDVEPFAARAGAVWRVSLRPGDGPRAVAALRTAGDFEAFYDWGGGLVWLLTPDEGDAGAALIRAETARLGGHATLVRAAAATRASVEVFEPEPAPLAALTRRIRAGFDPKNILNRGRMRA